MGENTIDLSIVIPAYNEERRLPASLRDVQSFFKKFPIKFEVIVVVEPSKDQTVAKSREVVGDDPNFQIIENKVHLGKGYAVRTGMQKARGEYAFFMDADLSTPLAEIISFLSHFNQHPEADLVIGSREVDRAKVLKKQSWVRRNLGRGFNRFVQWIAVRGITDTQCGFKAFRKSAREELFKRQRTNGFAFDVELLMLAQEMNYKIDVLPVRWLNSPDSKVRIWIDPIKMLIELLQMRLLVRRSLRELPPSPRSAVDQKSVS